MVNIFIGAIGVSGERERQREIHMCLYIWIMHQQEFIGMMENKMETTIEGTGFKDIMLMMENQMEMNMKWKRR